MATSGLWQRLSALPSSSTEWASEVADRPQGGSQRKVKLWMLLDVLTVLAATIIAAIYECLTASLSLCRMIYRILLYRRFESVQNTRNVMIVGTGPEAHALRHHLESIRHLGYTFKGFIEFSGTSSRVISNSGDRGRHPRNFLPAGASTICR